MPAWGLTDLACHEDEAVGLDDLAERIAAWLDARQNGDALGHGRLLSAVERLG
jgi:hypothetical protein